VTPIIIVLNNGIFGIEEMLTRTKGHAYDDLAGWQYHKLPEAMGCRDWYSVRLTTIGELDDALATARDDPRACYLDVVFDPTDLPAYFADDVLDTIYETRPR
jgi:indolepyruvate decarboxylase